MGKKSVFFHFLCMRACVYEKDFVSLHAFYVQNN